jgi:hypothetical protein
MSFLLRKTNWIKLKRLHENMRSKEINEALYRIIRRATLVAIVGLLTNVAGAQECKVDSDDSSTLTPCYQKELDDKIKANDAVFARLSKTAKKKAFEASESKNGGAAEKTYLSFASRLSAAVTDSRKTALRSCVHQTGKFQNKEMSAISIANCRTDNEITIEKTLKEFEAELNAIKN